MNNAPDRNNQNNAWHINNEGNDGRMEIDGDDQREQASHTVRRRFVQDNNVVYMLEYQTLDGSRVLYTFHDATLYNAWHLGVVMINNAKTAIYQDVDTFDERIQHLANWMAMVKNFQNEFGSDLLPFDILDHLEEIEELLNTTATLYRLN